MTEMDLQMWRFCSCAWFGFSSPVKTASLAQH